ncbi:MAG TPA: DNA-binding response regulator [Aminobacterium sp.]|jgi:DNA-binding NarL/FixJ family response regulator|uniref:response regulator transcription factor n=1 Tax=Aminobacterium TaxID=81466 RepID=UPI000465535B|nr:MULTISPECIES: response regulator transcription factor [Aminobacterium]HCA41259.1 DNA-binding response regulator [Aminobacterium sp.]
MEKITIVIADDHNMFRESLRKVLDLESDLEVVGEARDGQETVDVIERTNPQIVMLDIRMPKFDGIEVVTQLKKKGCPCKFIIITALDGENQITRISRAGIEGYVLKSSGLTELLIALRTVASGGSYVDPKVASKLLTSFSTHAEFREKMDLLTNREKQILYWVSHGLSSRDIAKQMILSNKTIQNHISQILKKLQLQEKGQAVALAWKWGLPERSPSDFSEKD